MPGKVGVKIKAGRNLPIMDRSSETTDAYVEIKLGNVTHKTDVCRKTLNPQWNTDWYRFEVDDAELQDEPLQIRLMDHDTYSANDAIGKVHISLNPLCLETSGQTSHGKGTVLSGWIPVFDTMHGIRGEVNVIVKVDLFSDVNKFRQSSCGIPFFHSQCIPFGYRAQVIHGFVEELVVNDDPEYQWIDKIRTPRASNEARQVVFLKLSGQVQRKMGLKAINMGANAVIGYMQCFDLEGDVGVVARGIGTAVTLIKDTSSQPATADNVLIEERTLQYLEFLTGSGVSLNEQPEFKLEIRKSASSTLFELQRTNLTEAEEDDITDIMHNLMRQEDERGEKPPKKLKHHVRRFTHSSRNMLNEKYTAFMRKISDATDSKSISRSLSSLFLNSTGKVDGTSGGQSLRNSLTDVRKQSMKAKKTKATAKQVRLAKPVHHSIVRSVSDDAGVKHASSSSVAGTGNTRSKLPSIRNAAEYQDSTRSSPNICSVEQQLRMEEDGKIAVGHGHVGDGHTFFGQFSTHEPHLLLEKLEEVDAQNSLSSTTISMTLSGSSSEAENQELILERSFEDDAEIEAEAMEETFNKLERAKVEELLRNCSANEEEKVAERWIQPGQLRSFDESLPDVSRHHSLLHELKVFSHHIQDFIHMPKRATITTTNQNKFPSKDDSYVVVKSTRRSPPKTLPLKPLASSERRHSFYSSQPEILIESSFEANLLAPPSLSAQLSHSLSLINLTKSASATSFCQTPAASAKDQDKFSANITKTTASTSTSPCVPSTQTQPQPQHNFPVLKICPSTPTPSESDNSQPTPSDTNSLPSASSSSRGSSMLVVLEPTAANTSNHTSKTTPSKKSVHVANPPSSSFNYSNPPSNTQYLNTSTNHSNMNSSLLAPSNSISLLCIKHQRHHRSLNEINAAGGQAGIADSPSMKRYASPASAAVAASAAATTNAVPQTFDGRTKLPPSPSKPIGTGTAGTGTGTQSQSESFSSTTASTATTMVAKDTGEMCRRSSDSDLSVTPKGNSFCVASDRLVAATAMMRLTQTAAGKTSNTEAIDMLEYPFLTITKYPTGFILHLGATVAARSVKLLERVPNPDEPEVRDSWWTELRMEIRSHARALSCNVVLGYSEATTISDDVCVLSATGTAAVINMAYNRSISQNDIYTMTKSGGMSASLEERDMFRDLRNIANNEMTAKESTTSSSSAQGSTTASSKKCGLPPLGISKNSCTMCHIPYNLSSVPFNVKMRKCAICRKGRVPDVLLTTLEVPEYLQVTGRGCFMQAQVVRAKKDLRSELNAKEISDGLPFLEYELHRVLINKLKAKGMNAIFGLRAQVSIGERMIALIATGTALFLSALPVPQVPKIVAGNSWTDKQKLNELQKKLHETFERNQEIYQLKCLDPDAAPGSDKQSDTDESDEEVIEIDLNCGNKDTCVLEVDDIEDLEIISLLMEPYPPEGFHVVNTQMVPGMVDMEAVKNLQMFTQVWRAKLDVAQSISLFPKHFQRLLQTIYFKLRTMIPCAICDLRFKLDLPESDQMQLLVTGMALGLGDSNKFKYRRKLINVNGDVNTNANTNIQAQEMNGKRGALQEEDYIFPLDEDHMVETPTPTTNIPPPYNSHSLKLRKSSQSPQLAKTNVTVRNRYFPLRDRYGIDITPLSFIPGGKIEKYLGNLNFFFIRESTSIRENGGISGFVHSFITELLAVVRAHIAAIGGNAMVSFYMTELILFDNQHKNQGQCLISIGGDAVYVTYYTDD